MSRPPPEARDGRARHYNRLTQPLHDHPVFNNPAVVPLGWYPLMRANELAAGAVRSVNVAAQRLAVWRGADGQPHAVDAFCAHMGADLGNGRVVGDDLQCYFHQWRYGSDGLLRGVRCGDPPAGVRLRAWPVREAWGLLWAWPDESPAHVVPSPPGLEGRPCVHHHLGTVRLYAHHHVMMAGGIDVQHFASVHGLSADMDVQIAEHVDLTAEWTVTGRLPTLGWRARLGRVLLGGSFTYAARFAGGSIVSLTYGPDARLRGTGRSLPSLHILWGCRPLATGISEVEVVLVAPRGAGAQAWLAGQARLLLTAGLLAVLTDDDARAFPWMRFTTGRLVALDESVARLARFINRLPLSAWTGATLTAAPADPATPTGDR